MHYELTNGRAIRIPDALTNIQNKGRHRQFATVAQPHIALLEGFAIGRRMTHFVFMPSDIELRPFDTFSLAGLCDFQSVARNGSPAGANQYIDAAQFRKMIKDGPVLVVACLQNGQSVDCHGKQAA